MPDYVLLMHGDSQRAEAEDGWAPYIDALRNRGCFQGGSAIGSGTTARKFGHPAAMSGQIIGFIRVEAGSLRDVHALLAGNPVYEAGGTIEIRELVRTD